MTGIADIASAVATNKEKIRRELSSASRKIRQVLSQQKTAQKRDGNPAEGYTDRRTRVSFDKLDIGFQSGNEQQEHRPQQTDSPPEGSPEPRFGER